MPFKSQNQRKFLFANHPEVAKEFAKATPPALLSSLPEHVGGAPGSAPHNSSVNLSPKNSFAAPKWATNPWGEMLKRKGIASLKKNAPGF